MEPQEVDNPGGLDLKWFDPHTLTEHPNNPRLHGRVQRIALTESLEKLGWLRPLTLNKRTGRLIDGHLRREQAIEQSVPAVPVIVVDLDEKREAIAIASLDRIGEMAEYDEKVMQSLLSQAADDEAFDSLRQIIAEGDVTGTGDNTLPDQTSGETSQTPAALVPNIRCDYVMLLFREQNDYAHAIEHFDLQRLRDPLRKVGKGRKPVIGQVRVVDGSKYLAWIREQLGQAAAKDVGAGRERPAAPAERPAEPADDGKDPRAAQP